MDKNNLDRISSAFDVLLRRNYEPSPDLQRSIFRRGFLNVFFLNMPPTVALFWFFGFWPVVLWTGAWWIGHMGVNALQAVWRPETVTETKRIRDMSSTVMGGVEGSLGLNPALMLTLLICITLPGWLPRSFLFSCWCLVTGRYPTAERTFRKFGATDEEWEALQQQHPTQEEKIRDQSRIIASVEEALRAARARSVTQRVAPSWRPHPNDRTDYRQLGLLPELPQNEEEEAFGEDLFSGLRCSEENRE